MGRNLNSSIGLPPIAQTPDESTKNSQLKTALSRPSLSKSFNTRSKSIYTLEKLAHCNYKEINNKGEDDFDPRKYGFDESINDRESLE